MLINILLLSIIAAVGTLIKLYPPLSILNNSTYALGMIMLGGYLTGKLASRFKIPSVTGYILAGIFLGPYTLQIISIKNVSDLQLLNGLALSIIALTAGGEIKYAGLRKNIRAIGYILIFQTLFIIIGTIALLFILKMIFPFFQGYNFNTMLAIGILVGIISTASSPSTTLAVIVESRIKNRITELILSIVMLKDVVILFLFVIGLSISKLLLSQTIFKVSSIYPIFVQTGGSLALGILIGLIIVLYLKYIRRDTIIFILALSFFGYEIFEPLHLHPLLIMMVAGFVVENLSDQGDRLIKNLEAISPPVYILFFTITGASIDLAILKSLIALALVVTSFRLLFHFIGTYAGGVLSNESHFVKKSLWMSFVSQAGLSLGMATIIEANFGTFGSTLATLIISVIIINQLIGPPLLKWALTMSPSDQNNG